MTLSRRVVGVFLSLSLLGSSGANGQDAIDEAPSKVKPPAKVAKAAVSPKAFRLRLSDGVTLEGELTMEQFVLETEYGTLKIPVDRVRSFTPGLSSNPRQSRQIRLLIEALGGDNFSSRERAHQEIVKLGPSFRKVLEPFANDSYPERKHHVRAILKKLAELEEKLKEQAAKDGAGAASSRRVWERLDTIVTTDCTLSGKISPGKIAFRSKLGELSIALADVAQADRISEELKRLAKTIVVVSGENTQSNYKSSNVTVRPGDRITIKADGKIRMTRWGNGKLFSSPDGDELYNWYVQDKIPGGTLIAKIGSDGPEFKVGSRREFVASSAGTLEFAVAVQEQFSKVEEGNFFPGHYSVRIRVIPREASSP